jgi:hypothetical protein
MYIPLSRRRCCAVQPLSNAIANAVTFDASFEQI